RVRPAGRAVARALRAVAGGRLPLLLRRDVPAAFRGGRAQPRRIAGAEAVGAALEPPALEPPAPRAQARRGRARSLRRPTCAARAAPAFALARTFGGGHGRGARRAREQPDRRGARRLRDR